MSRIVLPDGSIELEHDRARQKELMYQFLVGPSDKQAARELLKRSWARTLPGNIKLPPGRGFPTEGIEEVCDLVNYSPWGTFEGQIPAHVTGRVCQNAVTIYKLLRPYE